MNLAFLASTGFIVFFGVILGLVAPYVGVASSRYHSIVPMAVAISYGTLLWAGLSAAGLSQTEPWIWLIVMLSMPAAMWFFARLIDRKRKAKYGI
jgi:VIT1/CCC1 family predicted Fe2+/Mn2+ transporter